MLGITLQYVSLLYQILQKQFTSADTKSPSKTAKYKMRISSMFFHRPEIIELSPPPQKKMKKEKKWRQEHFLIITWQYRILPHWPHSSTRFNYTASRHLKYVYSKCIYIKSVMETSMCFHTAIICNHKLFTHITKKINDGWTHYVTVIEKWWTMLHKRKFYISYFLENWYTGLQW